jgi:hypothetical protein
MTTRGEIGEQGVSLVIAELLARGFKPYRPVVDDHGVDLMLSDGTRIQVKSANLSVMWAGNRKTGKSGPTGNKGYQFSLQRTVFGTKEKLQSVGITYEYRDMSKDSDYLILVGLDERRFWIVPTGIISECKHIVIANGVSQTKNGPKFRFWKAIRSGENKWDMLASGKLGIPDSLSLFSSNGVRYEDATFAGPVN